MGEPQSSSVLAYLLSFSGSPAPALEEVSGEGAFMALVANTYVNYLLDQAMRRREF